MMQSSFRLIGFLARRSAVTGKSSRPRLDLTTKSFCTHPTNQTSAIIQSAPFSEKTMCETNQRQNKKPFLKKRFLSSSSTTANEEEKEKTSDTGKYAAVDHSAAYEASMKGRHGAQLKLAELEGAGKDDPPFDPFIEDEHLEDEERRRRAGLPEKLLEEEDEDEGESFEDDDDLTSSVYNNDGSLRRTKSEIAKLRAGAPAGGIFAVLELAGSQHKVTTDDVLIVNRLRPTDKFQVGSVHTLDEVLLVSSSHMTLVGMPYVLGAQVDVMVEEITRDAKVIIFKKRRRKNSQSKNGFRRDVTMLRVLDIRPPEKHADHEHVERAPPAALIEAETEPEQKIEAV